MREVRDIVAGVFGIRPVLTEAGDGAPGQPRIRLMRLREAEAARGHRAWLGVLDHHIDAGRHLQQHFARSRVPHVERHRLLAAAHADLPEHRAGLTLERGRFDADHFGAEIGQHHRAHRTGREHGEIEDANARKGRQGHAIRFLQDRRIACQCPALTSIAATQRERSSRRRMGRIYPVPEEQRR